MSGAEAGNFGLGARALLQRADFQTLIDSLTGRGFDVLGPTVRNGAVVYERVRTVEDLATGLRDEQAGGYYHPGPRGDSSLFGYTHGAFRQLVLKFRTARRAGQTPPFSPPPARAGRPASRKSSPAGR